MQCATAQLHQMQLYNCTVSMPICLRVLCSESTIIEHAYKPIPLNRIGGLYEVQFHKFALEAEDASSDAAYFIDVQGAIAPPPPPPPCQGGCVLN